MLKNRSAQGGAGDARSPCGTRADCPEPGPGAPEPLQPLDPRQALPGVCSGGFSCLRSGLGARAGLGLVWAGSRVPEGGPDGRHAVSRSGWIGGGLVVHEDQWLGARVAAWAGRLSGVLGVEPVGALTGGPARVPACPPAPRSPPIPGCMTLLACVLASALEPLRLRLVRGTQTDTPTFGVSVFGPKRPLCHVAEGFALCPPGPGEQEQGGQGRRRDPARAHPWPPPPLSQARSVRRAGRPRLRPPAGTRR